MDMTIKMAKAPEMIMDVDSEKAALGREPAERAHRVDEGDETEHRCQSRLPQTNLHEQNCEHNGNAQADIHTTYGLPLQGEWEVCASSEMNKVKTDGLGGQTDTPSGCRDAPSIQMDAIVKTSSLLILSFGGSGGQGTV